MEDSTDKYGYSFQYFDINDYKIRDMINKSDIYSNIDECVDDVNAFLKCAIERIESIEDFDGDLKLVKNELVEYPITKEFISRIKYHEYVYYDTNMYWAYVIIKHRIM